MKQEVNIQDGSNQINPAATCAVQNYYFIGTEPQSHHEDEVVPLRRDFNFDEINRKILDAHEVWIFGLGCTITIKLLYDKCINLHSLTQHMRFLFMDSKGHVVRIAAKREGKPNRKVQERYEENWKLIEELATAFPEQIHYKKIDYLPPYNLFIFNPHRDDAELYVHIAGWKSASTDGRPLIVLNKRSHPYWFNYFQSEFNKMWKKEADPA